MGEIRLHVEALRFGYVPERLLFDGFDLTLRAGELKAVVGPSGSGKSTLFELILGQLKPQGGVIRASRLSQVFQDPYSSFHPSYTLLEQIADVAPLEGMEAYLEQMELEPSLMRQLPHRLSGGQLQRASIIRAMLMRPELLLLDEPTSALDNVTQLQVMQMLMRHLDRMAMLLITHDTHLAHWCADEIIDITSKSVPPA